MAFSLRLDPQTETEIRRLAEATGRSKSAVVREAMRAYAAAQVQEVKYARTALERLRPFVGIVAGEGDGSIRTHEKFRSIVEHKHRGRRRR